MKKTLSTLAVLAGILLSGLSAFWGACLAGHDSGAGYPFPDTKGIALFIFGAIFIPSALAIFTPWLDRFISKRIRAFRIKTPAAILILGPLLGLACGYAVQLRDNHASSLRKEFYAEQKEAYSHYASLVSADPGIVLRERWFKQPEPPWDAAMSARQMVFHDSFDPGHLSVPYTAEQLRKISGLPGEQRLLVLSHPMCPPDLIEAMWRHALSSGESGVISRIIDNPATPLHLIEEYQTEFLESNQPVPGWIRRALEKRLKDDD